MTTPAPGGDPSVTCRCGHAARAAHGHWRDGSNCGRCGPYRCPRFRPAAARPPMSSGLRRLVGIGVGAPAGILALVVLATSAGAATVAGALLVILIAALWLLLRHPDEDQDDEPDADGRHNDDDDM